MENLNEKDFYFIYEDEKFNEEKEKVNIVEQVNINKGLVIIVYSFSAEIEEIIKFGLTAILDRYGKSSLVNTVYNVLFESILNGLKANAKKLFFLENSLNIDDPNDYAKGILLFKKDINKSNLRQSGERNRERNIFVRVKFDYSDDGLEIEVLNNTQLLPAEESRIREKLALGEKYDDLMSFYLDNSDSTEGEGLGLVLSLILLKAEKLDPSLFRIGTKNGLTFARIEIPFTSEFISKRTNI
ncbi:MAG TPA: histidine kinase [Leptospiraceae bacterium]|nr:histidine kinase [Leptospiraceae bacterium]HNA07664.1 histidine kinase [Leptospiraceae bacterium]HNH00223.1 histidine kinase [Leptospiraceae bacterium]